MTAWSRRHITCLNDHIVKEALEQFEGLVTEDASTCVDWAHLKGNQVRWLKKTMAIRTSTSGCRMVQVLQIVRKDLSDEDCTANGEKVRASLALMSQREPIEKAHAMFRGSFAAARGDEERRTKLETIPTTVGSRS